MNDLNDFCESLVVRKNLNGGHKGREMLNRRLFLGLAALAVSVFGNQSVRAAEPVAKDIVTTAVEAGSFGTLATALKAAGLVETLQKKGPFTVFAPTDAAFAKLPAGTVETLLKPENKKQLIAVLTYHVVAGKVPAAEVVKLDAAPTVNGQRVKLKVEGDTVQVGAATVAQADIFCSNGVIHVIDQVLIPSLDSIPVVAGKAGVFKTLLAAAKAAGLVEVLAGNKPLTVFAPTDEAFAKLPAGTVESLLQPENKATLAAILTFHVIPGRVYSDEVLGQKDLTTVQGGKLTAVMKSGKATINGAQLMTTDIDAANGVIHVIDTVLLPPKAPAKAAAVHVPPQHSVNACPNTGRTVNYTARRSGRR